MADLEPTPVTPLASGFPSLQPNSSGSSSGTATETPYGATKTNPLGIEKGAIIERNAANADIGAAQGEQDTNALTRAGIDLSKANAVGAQDTANLDQMHAFNDAFTKDFNERKAGQKRLEDSINEAAKFHDHFTDKNVGDKLIATIASGLLGFGTGQYHNEVARIEGEEHAKQQAQLDALMKQAERYGANTTQLREIYDDASNNMRLTRAARLEQIAHQYDVQAATAGTVEAKTAAKTHAALLRKQKNEELLKYDQGLRTKSQRSATQAVKAPAAAKQD